MNEIPSFINKFHDNFVVENAPAGTRMGQEQLMTQQFAITVGV